MHKRANGGREKSCGKMLSTFRFEEGFVKIRPHSVFRCGDKIDSEDLSSAHSETLGKEVEVRRVLRHLRFGGDAQYVAAYSVIMYVYCVDLLLLQGVGDGVQPLISLMQGEGDRSAVLRLRNYAYVTALIVAAICFATLFGLRHVIPDVFGAGEFAAAESARILPFFAGSALFTAVSKITAAYFYSMDRNSSAYVLVYGEVAVILLFVLTLPERWGIDGVWMSLPIAQVVIALVALALLYALRRRFKKYPDRPEYIRTLRA